MYTRKETISNKRKQAMLAADIAAKDLAKLLYGILGGDGYAEITVYWGDDVEKDNCGNGNIEYHIEVSHDGFDECAMGVLKK